MKCLSRKFGTIFTVALLVFSLVGKVYGKESSHKETSSQQQREISVRGLVTDEKGEPLPGVTVLVKGSTNQGTSTDFDGRYTLSVPSDATLVFSYVGFETKEVAVKGRTTINIQLKEEAQELEGVVVTAYGGGQKKASIVGAVQSITPTDLKVPSANLSTSFAGRMAGVIAFQRGGQPGADGANFYIRGIATMSGATNPLIIVDGIEVSQGDLNALTPEVIEGFTLLKDATATALYGSRGANGVMIITTKSGADLEKPIINFRIEGTMSQPTSIPKMTDGVTYMRLFNEAANNLSSGAMRYSQDRIDGTYNNLNPYVYPNVNWYNETFKDRAYGQKINFNIRGGGKKLDYFMSMTANLDGGMIKGLSKDYFSYDNNISVKKYAFQNNINARLTPSSRLSLRLNAQLNDSRTPNVDEVNGLFENVIKIPPVENPVMFPSDGITNHIKWGTNSERYYKINPVAELVRGYRDNFQSTVIANVEYDQKLDIITEGLKFNGLVSFKNWSSTSVRRTSPYNMYTLAGYSVNPDGSYELTPELVGTNAAAVVLSSEGRTTGDRKLYLQGMLDYTKTFAGVHAVNAMVVYNQEEYNLNNYTPDKDSTSFKILVNSLPKRKQTLAGRISYAYDNRYMVEVNAGYNGSENFADGNRWGFFPSVAVGYNISEEPFFQNLKDVIQVFKIRNSWGLVGNDQIGGERFIYMPAINLSGRNFRTGINQDYSLNGPKYIRYANYGLTWEVGEKLNFGVDMTLFNSLNIHFDMFREHRRNIFQERKTIPKYLGLEDTKVYANTGEVINKGIDLSVDYNKKIGKDWSLSAKGTFTYAHNTIVKYDESVADYPNLSLIGKSLETHMGYVSEGFFIDANEVANRPTQKISSNVAAGDLKYYDFPNANGVADGQIDANDRTTMGYPKVPEIVYGLGLNASYKRWDAGVFFQGVANTSLMISGIEPFGTLTPNNVFQWIADSHWSQDNQNLNAAYPRLTKDSHANNTTASSFWLRDASFLKLKTAEIGYSYKNMRIFATATNLLTFSNFKLWDPEQGDGNGLKYPTQRTFTIGFQMTFNNK